MDDANARAFLDRVPDVLGDLEVAQHGAIGALLVGLAQVHVSNGTRTIAVYEKYSNHPMHVSMPFWSISSDDLRNALIFGTTTACFAQTCMSKCQRRVQPSTWISTISNPGTVKAPNGNPCARKIRRYNRPVANRTG